MTMKSLRIALHIALPCALIGLTGCGLVALDHQAEGVAVGFHFPGFGDGEGDGGGVV